MNWKTIITIALLLPLLWTACNQPKNESKPVEMELHGNVYPLTLEKEKEYPFNVISKEPPILAKIDDADHVHAYVRENQDRKCEVLKFNLDLELKGKYFFGKGEGPGEAISPWIFGGDERSIIVFDPPFAKYIRFDTVFKLMAEYRAKNDKGVFLYSGYRYDPVRNLVVDGFKETLNRYDGRVRLYLRKFSDTGAPKDIKVFETARLNYRKDNRKYIEARVLHFGNVFDHIYILDKRIYRLIKMDMEGNIVEDKKIKLKSVFFSTADRKRWISGWRVNDKYYSSEFDFPEKLYTASWLIQWGDGIAVGRCEDYDPENKGPVTADYFDKDLNYLGRITLPYFNWWNHPFIGQNMACLLFHSKGGKVYFCDQRDEENDESWLVRYGLKRESNGHGARSTEHGGKD